MMRNDPIETEQVENYTVNVFQDDTGIMEPFDCDMPKTWGIDLSNHRDYKSPTYGEACPADMEDLMMDLSIEGYTVLPVFLYSHSGRTVSTSPFSCTWDSGCAGVAYISNAEAEKEGIPDPEEYLKNTVKELDYHMTGQLYGYVIEDENGENIDSCWGFVGDSDYCLVEGKAVAEAILNSLPKQGTLFQDEPEEEVSE